MLKCILRRLESACWHLDFLIVSLVFQDDLGAMHLRTSNLDFLIGCRAWLGGQLLKNASVALGPAFC